MATPKGIPTPEESLFLFIDLQEGIATLPLSNSNDGIAKSAAALAKLAKLRSVPVIVSTVPGADGSPAPLISKLAEALGESKTFVRTHCDSSQELAIIEAIKSSGKKKIVIAGVATEVAVALPAASLSEMGYEVFVATDATGALSARSETAIWQTLAARGVQLTSVASIAGVFAEDFSKPEGWAAIEIVFSMAD